MTARSKENNVERRCLWGRCGMQPTLFGTGTKHRLGWCLWHWQCRTCATKPDYDDFLRWIEQLRKRGYCCEWTHCSAPYLWDVTEGQPGGSKPARQPCAHSNCPIAPSSEEATAYEPDEADEVPF